MDVSRELKVKFELASMRREAKTLRRDTDWEKGRKILDKYQQIRQEIGKDYFDTYEARVADVTKDLINKAGSKKKEFTPRWFSVDQFDKKAIAAQAHEMVQLDHHARILSIDQRESSELNDLLSQVRQRDEIRQQNKESFNRASDRRTSVTRQQSGPRR